MRILPEEKISFKGINLIKIGDKLRIIKGSRATHIDYKQYIKNKSITLEEFTKFLGVQLSKFAPNGEPFLNPSDIPDFQETLKNFLEEKDISEDIATIITPEESAEIQKILSEAKKETVKTEVKEPVPVPSVDSTEITKTYEDLKSQGRSHEEIVSQLSQKYSLSVESVESLLPKTGILKHIVQAKTEALTTTEVSAGLMDKVYKQFDQLPADRKDMIHKLAKIFRQDIKTFLQTLTSEARKSKPPRSWLAHATALCIEHGLYQVVRGRGYHALLCNAEKVWEVLIPDKADIKIDYCYKVGETTGETVARVIAKSNSVKLSKLPKTDQAGDPIKLYNYIEPVGEMSAIPRSYQVLSIPDNLKTIQQIYEELKTKGAGYYVISGEIHDFNSKGEEFWFLKIIDGSEPYDNFFSLALGVPNQFGIDENILRNCISKTVLSYAYCVLRKGVESGFKLDSIQATPEALFMG